MEGSRLSKSLIQLSDDGWGSDTPCCLTSDQTLVEEMKIMATSFKRFRAYTVTLSAPNLQQATADPHCPQRLLHTHRQVWASLLWGHCSLLLGPGAHKVLFMLSKCVFPHTLCNFCNQIPLTSKVKFPGTSQSLCQIPSLGNLLWVLEIS